MRKILSLILGLLWAVPAFADLDPCRNLLNTPERLEVSKWYKSTGTIVSTDPDTRTYTNFTIQIIKSGSDAPAPSGCARNFYGPVNNFKCTFKTPENTTSCRFYNNGERVNSGTSIFPCEPNTQYTFSMDVISANPTIRNGIIYSHMQLEKGATATEFTPACTGINVATTKYTNKQFEPLDLMLSNAISVVDTVVSNTITQAGRIATLQTQKQTRPNDIADDNEKCPAGKKCLLVEDASGVPHWYEIVENASLLPNGYTELAYLTSGTDGQYIDTGILFDPTKNFRVVGNFINPDATLRKVILGNYYSQQIETYYSIELYSDGKFRNYMSADAGSAFNIYSPTAVPADTIAYFDTSYDALAHQTTTTLRYGTTEQTYSGATPETTTVAVHTLKLFNDKRNSSPVYNYPVSIGAVQIYIDDILAHHYVPARRESDGVLGMYDTVSGQFFTNSGDGEFIAGDPVSE